MCRKQNPDCILLDYQIPDLDGLEFIAALAKDEHKRFIPVLMLTGQGNESIASQALKGGASDYLIKTDLTAKGLNRAVSNAIEKSGFLRNAEKQPLEIERCQKELEQFAYTASHDLQAHVRRIIKFVELLQKDLHGQINARSQDYLDRVLKGALHMRQFIQDLLSFSLVGGGNTPMEPVNLQEVVQEVLTGFDFVIQENQAHVEFGELPTIMGNRALLQQLFQNLIGNALKFQSEKPPVVDISAHFTGPGWLFTVKDNGVGIPAESLEEVFGIFQRLDNSSKVEGTGIGLALCRKILAFHDGRIWVESAEQKGTTFHFTLPQNDSRHHQDVKNEK